MKNLFTILLFVFLSLTFTTPAFADVNNFSISNFAIDYYLDQDEDGRSTLRVVENITASFPNFDQNKGLVRKIPRLYDGRSLSFSLISVERDKRPEPIYAKYKQGDFHIIETGTDDYVVGAQTYTFTYTLRDVTKYFEDTDRDEFYWNTNGTGWRVPTDRLEVRLHIADDLRPLLTGDVSCYQGARGATNPCVVAETETGFIAHATTLRAYENLTLAIGFQPHTFTPYPLSWFEKLMPHLMVLQIIGAVAGFLGLAWSTRRRWQWTYRQDDLGTIVPEYLPPQDISVTAAANLLSVAHSVFTAQLIDLAVRGYIQIIETRTKSFWRAAEYDLKVIKPLDDLRAEEKEILSDMFGSLPAPERRLSLSALRKDFRFSRQLQDNPKKLQKLIRHTYHLRTQDPTKTSWFDKLSLWLFIPSIFTLNIFLFFVAAIIKIQGKTLWPLSDQGLAWRRYLKGLELYIKVAETERIKMLQSPSGAEKVGLGVADDPAKLVKLYERVLPYAILFHQEKEWQKELGQYYKSVGGTPTWYSSSSGHSINPVTFSAMVNNFSQAVASTSGGNSGSGGSGGGGSSGGGGGGGGGGGR